MTDKRIFRITSKIDQSRKMSAPEEICKSSSREDEMKQKREEIFKIQQDLQKKLEDKVIVEKYHFKELKERPSKEMIELIKKVWKEYILEKPEIYNYGNEPIDFLNLFEQDTEYLEDKQVKYASIDNLIGFISSSDYKDHVITDDFLLVYRSIMTPIELIEKLIKRYNTPPPLDIICNKEEDFANWKRLTLDLIRFRILFFMNQWMEKCPYDFTDQVFKKLEIFIEIIKSLGTFTTNVEKLLLSKERIINLLKSQKTYYIDFNRAPKTIEPKEFGVQILNWDPTEIARQLVLIEFEMFSNIQVYECFNQAWIKPNREIDSPNIVKIVKWFNKISLFFSNFILEDSLKDRTERLKFVLKIAEESRKINNYNALFELISALSSTPIHRLKKTWNNLSNENLKKFEELQDYILPNQSYKILRSSLTFEYPCLPYPGMLLSDLIFIDEGNKNMVNEKVNFLKMRKMAKTLSELIQYQQKPFVFHPVKLIKEILTQEVTETDQTLYEKSLKLEPRKEEEEEEEKSDWRNGLKEIKTTLGRDSTSIVSAIGEQLFGEVNEKNYYEKKLNRRFSETPMTKSYSDPNIISLTPKTLEKKENKAGYIQISEFGKIQFKKRFCILQGAYLLFFENEKSQKELGNILLQTALIENYSYDLAIKEFGKIEIIRILGKKNYVLLFTSIDEALEWGLILRRAALRFTGNTLTVDPINGPIKLIQDAIIKSQNLDKIIIKPGIYQESIIINKNIEIQGSKGVIIIGKVGPSITIASNGAIKLSLLELESEHSSIILKTGNLYLSSCDIKSGIKTFPNTQLTISRCNIISSPSHGISLKGFLSLENSLIQSNQGDGINQNGNCILHLRKNIITSNQGYGIMISTEIYCKLEFNIISRNLLDGISTKSTLIANNNEFFQNKGHGIVLLKKSNKLEFLKDNKFEKNERGDVTTI